MEADPTKRFSDRVDNYIKYRPGYPPEVLEYLKDECELPPYSVIADVGAGTGIFTQLLLEQDYEVYAIEPNEAMRDAAIAQLSADQNFTAINGTANDTSLPAGIVDLIVCAQAFHWFNNDDTRVEFKRILKDAGKVALIWNNRLTKADTFAVEYDALLKNDAVDYNKVNHQNVSDIDFRAFFNGGIYKQRKFRNVQVFDEEGLTGRAFSSSYVPPQGTVNGDRFLKLLKDLFYRYNENGKVSFHYETEIYLGKV